MPSGGLTVIGCVDPRVDPSDVLGLKLGEAAVIRNVGGRVTPAILRTLEMLSKVVQSRTGGPRPGDNHYAVLHHTYCGITDLAASPNCWPTTSKFRPETWRRRRSPTRSPPSASTSKPSSRGFGPESSSQGSCTTWPPGSSTSSSRPREWKHDTARRLRPARPP
ncbi:carbonic anhydrase [Streptomyces sp. NPDC001792]|uniref:carbonic anhydrase n=1 Tax=Streptomyces sp. NPDC001792 TaxID=3154524 RepID=UPI00331BAE65